MNEFVKRTMSAIDRPNLRRWAGVGWGTKEVVSYRHSRIVVESQVRNCDSVCMV